MEENINKKAVKRLLFNIQGDLPRVEESRVGKKWAFPKTTT
jgi:hypothetical protein